MVWRRREQESGKRVSGKLAIITSRTGSIFTSRTTSARKKILNPKPATHRLDEAVQVLPVLVSADVALLRTRAAAAHNQHSQPEAAGAAAAARPLRRLHPLPPKLTQRLRTAAGAVRGGCADTHIRRVHVGLLQGLPHDVGVCDEFEHLLRTVRRSATPPFPSACPQCRGRPPPVPHSMNADLAAYATRASRPEGRPLREMSYPFG